MHEQTKDYIKSLLSIIKSLYAENYALRAMNQASPIQAIRESWEQSLKEILEMPETQKEIDARFDPQIERILQLLADPDAVDALLQMPTKGLPS